jgi:hypothetical protein
MRAPANGAGPVTMLYDAADTGTPAGLVVDRDAGRLYWAASGADEIRSAPLDGSGPVTTLHTTGDTPHSLALDSQAGRLYWTEANGQTIRSASVAGGGPVTTLYSGLSNPRGVVVDTAERRMYWVDVAAATVNSAPLDGSGPIETLYTVQTNVRGAIFIGDPVPVSPPQASPASGGIGTELACTTGTWAPERPTTQAFRPPPTGFAYQWQRDGADIPGATASTFTPSAPGSHRCVVTGDNGYGETSQTSNAVTIARAAPSITGAASPGVALGGSVSDTAKLAGFDPLTPGATIDFRLYGPDDATCSGTPVFESLARPVDGAGGAASEAFTPLRPGTYRWRATFSGDARNEPVTSVCDAPGQTVAVADVPPLPALTLTGLFMAPKRFAPGPSTVAFALSRPATVVYRIDRILEGKQRRGRCTVTGASRKSGPRCIRYDQVDRRTAPGTTGANRFTLDVRELGTGRYRLRVTAESGGTVTPQATVRFRVT